MKKFLAAVATMAFLLVYVDTAHAVAVYTTTHQGGATDFLAPDPAETDLLGNTGVTPIAAGAVKYNLWIDPQGSTITFLGLRLVSAGGAAITVFNDSATLDDTVPGDSTAIVAGIMTITNTLFAGCTDFAAAIPATAQGSCVASPAFAATAPDQTAPMLIGTITVTSAGAGTVSILADPLSSYIAGGPETFFANQVLIGAAAPEPASMALLGLGLAGLAFVRRRS